MPRTLWRLRRGTDSPRPAGRRWAGRLRRPRVLTRRARRTYPHRLDGLADPHRAYRATGHPASRVAVAAPPGAAWPGGGPGAGAAPGTPLGASPDLPVGTPLDVPPAAAVVGGAPATPLTPPAPGRLLPGAATAGRRARFVLANLCTVASLALGVLAILLAMRGEVRTAALCLIACVICDGLDGALARRFGVSSPFGAQMDSMADMCAFGIAAPVVLYASLAGTVPRPAAAVACALVAACAAIRLARFNVSEHDTRFFHGVPTTAGAAVLALAVLMDLPLPATFQLAGMALLGFAMVSSFPYATITRLVRLPSWLWLAPLAGALVNPQVTFLVLVGAYLASGPLLWLRQRRTA